MSVAIDAISVLGTGISTYSFLNSLFGGQKSSGANVVIHASTGRNAATGQLEYPNTGGRVRDVYGYDDGGILLGDSGGASVGRGGKHEFHIAQGNKQQALYVDVVADTDDICIPVIAVTQPGGGAKFGWMGDVFKACGLQWYYGNVVVQGDYSPLCGWIDADHNGGSGDGVGQASFKWYLPSFSSSGVPSNDPNFYCHPRPFEVRYDAQPIEKRSIEARQERSERIRRGFKFNELIVSEHAHHPASELCEDENSLGSDFVSLHEKTYCDMTNKKWYNLCDESAGILDNCFALDALNSTMTGVFSHPKALGLLDSVVSYDRTLMWDKN